MTDEAPKFPYSEQLAAVQSAAADPAPTAEPVSVQPVLDALVIVRNQVGEIVDVVESALASSAEAEAVRLDGVRALVQGVGEAIRTTQEQTSDMRKSAVAAAERAAIAADRIDFIGTEVRADLATFAEMFEATMSRRQRKRLRRYHERIAKES